jgi:predicted double-glycine peptidase
MMHPSPHRSSSLLLLLTIPLVGLASAPSDAAPKACWKDSAGQPTRRTAHTRTAPQVVPRNLKLIHVPDVRQAQSYTCGAACLQSVIGYFGRGEPREGQLARKLRTTPRWGSDPSEIVKVATLYRLEPALEHEMSLKRLESLVKTGVPVMVTYQAWRTNKRLSWSKDQKDGHYSIVVGMDKKHVYLEDPALFGRLGMIPRGEFSRRWHDVDRHGNVLHHLGIAFMSRTPPIRPGLVTRIE